jgi:hypothetical protein
MRWFLIMLVIFAIAAGMTPSKINATAEKKGSGNASGIDLPAGTPVRLISMQVINSNRNKKGDEIVFAVAEDIDVKGKTLLVRGTPVVGKITELSSAKGWGRSGKMEVIINTINPIYSDPIKLTGNIGKDSSSRNAAAIGAGYLVGVNVFGALAGGSVKGKKAKIEPGTSVLVYTSNDAKVRDISTERKREMVDNWYQDKVISKFLNYTWDQKKTISQAMESLGYKINKSEIKIKHIDDYTYEVDVTLSPGQHGLFKFDPFDAGYTKKYRTVDSMNDAAKRVLESV